MSLADLAAWLARGRRPEAVALVGLAASLCGIIASMVGFVYTSGDGVVRGFVFLFYGLFCLASGVAALTFSDALSLIRRLRRAVPLNGAEEGSWLLHDVTPMAASMVAGESP